MYRATPFTPYYSVRDDVLAVQAVTLDVEDLEADATPEDLMLSYVSGEKGKVLLHKLHDNVLACTHCSHNHVYAWSLGKAHWRHILLID